MAPRTLSRQGVVKLITVLAGYCAVESFALAQGYGDAHIYERLIGLAIIQFMFGMGIESWLTIMRKGSLMPVIGRTFALTFLYVVPGLAVNAGMHSPWALGLSIVWFAALMFRVGLIIGRSGRQDSVASS